MFAASANSAPKNSAMICGASRISGTQHATLSASVRLTNRNAVRVRISPAGSAATAGSATHATDPPISHPIELNVPATT